MPRLMEPESRLGFENAPADCSTCVRGSSPDLIAAAIAAAATAVSGESTTRSMPAFTARTAASPVEAIFVMPAIFSESEIDEPVEPRAQQRTNHLGAEGGRLFLRVDRRQFDVADHDSRRRRPPGRA